MSTKRAGGKWGVGKGGDSTTPAANYRAPFRVYKTCGWREYDAGVVCEDFADITQHGQGLYGLSEDSWYAEDANGVRIDKDDIPLTHGFYEVTVYASGEINTLFSGWHAGTKPMPKKRRIFYMTCTGPMWGQNIDKKRDQLRVGFGKTWKAALRHAKTGRRI